MEREHPICTFCKLMGNPLKRRMLLAVYAAQDGVNVGVMTDAMQGIELSGVSQYFKQLATLGVIRRSRAGRYVNYYPDPMAAASEVQIAVAELLRDKDATSDRILDAVFAALGNPFRAKAVAAIAEAGVISSREICERTLHQIRYLVRDLKPAVDAGLIRPSDDSSVPDAYQFIQPFDPFVRTMVECCQQAFSFRAPQGALS